MNPKYRSIYLLLGFAGLVYLFYHLIVDFSLWGTRGLNPGVILLIALPDFALFFLAYKTYPVENEVKR
ncbi:MAG TPA: hypothetical protein VIJ27_00535 [Mucilaginibacter sp.]